MGLDVISGGDDWFPAFRQAQPIFAVCMFSISKPPLSRAGADVSRAGVRVGEAELLEPRPAGA